MYTNRLRIMRPLLKAAAVKKWGLGGVSKPFSHPPFHPPTHPPLHPSIYCLFYQSSTHPPTYSNRKERLRCANA